MSLGNFIPLFTTFIETLSKMLLGVFIYNKGKDKVRLDSSQEEIKDVKESKKLSSSIAELDDATLHSGLRRNKKPTKS